MGAMSVRYSDRLTMRFGAKNVLLGGMVAILGGLLLFALTPVDANYLTDVVPPVVLIGLGAGTAFPAIVTLAMSGATMEDSGPGVRPGERHHAGGRRDRAGGARHPGERPHGGPASPTASRGPRP